MLSLFFLKNVPDLILLLLGDLALCIHISMPPALLLPWREQVVINAVTFDGDIKVMLAESAGLMKSNRPLDLNSGSHMY